ncbi:MAG: hypothetical protein MR821_11880 [Clostridiales bacterium]|nr:hypothetical protein [Clostridiales bacterium]
MGRVTVSTKDTASQSQTHSESQSQSQSQSQSTTQKLLDGDMLGVILSGLAGQMTDEEIRSYAQGLLEPQKNAELEASRQKYEAAKLSREQEIESLAASLQRSIAAQNSAYRQSAADVQTEALKRGMGRSSYTMQTLANQGSLLAEAIRQLTEENERKSSQLQAQITQAAEQNAQTQGRVERDYAAGLLAKEQELRRQQQQEYNRNYLTAVSAAMGQQTNSASATQGQQTGTSTTTGGSSSVSSARQEDSWAMDMGQVQAEQERIRRAAAGSRTKTGG